MKKIIFSLVALLSLFVTQLQAAETYNFDPYHTAVSFKINHFGYSNPSGKWYANGTLIYDEANVANSKVNVIIKVGDIVTGIPKLDEHLLGKDFFNVAEFPTATFVSDKIKAKGKDKLVVTGNLTLHGVTKPVTLYVTINKIAVNPFFNKKVIGISASGEIKRSDFGISAYLPDLGDKVTLDIEAEAQLADIPPAAKR